MEARQLKIGIIGAGEVGTRLAKEFAPLLEHPVAVSDKSGEKLEVLARSANSPRVVATENSIQVAKDSEILYIATAPVRNNPGIIAEIAPHVKHGAIIVEESSVKTYVEKALLRYTPQTVGISLRHMMGAPSLPSMVGVTRAIIPVRTIDPEKLHAVDELETLIGFNPVEIESADLHDQYTAVVQGETQTWAFAAGQAWLDLGFHKPTDVKFPKADEYKNPLDHIKWMLTLRMYKLHLRSKGVYPDIAALNQHVTEKVEQYLRTGQWLTEKREKGGIREVMDRCLEVRDLLGIDNIAESEEWIMQRAGRYRPEDQKNSNAMILANGISWLTSLGGPVKPRELLLFASPPYRWFLRVTEAAFGSCLEKFVDNLFNNPEVRYHDDVFWNAAHNLCGVLLLQDFDPVKKAEAYEARLTQNAASFEPKVLQDGFDQSQALFKKENL